MDVWATIPGRAGRVRIGSAEREGDTVRLHLDALPAGDAVLELDLPALAVGEALLAAVDAAQPYYGRGADGAVRVYREDDGTWSAGRNDDYTIRRDRAPTCVDALAGLTEELRAEYARRCPHCGVADDHDDPLPERCPGRDDEEDES